MAMIPSRPRSRLNRTSLAAIVGVIFLGALVMGAGAVAGWSDVHNQSVVQSGPRVVASVLGHTVTKTETRGGPKYTTRYTVVFRPLGQSRPVRTVVKASGLDPCGCARTLVAYSRPDPTQAELAGDGTASRGTAIFLTVLAVLFLVLALLVLRSGRRALSISDPDRRDPPRLVLRLRARLGLRARLVLTILVLLVLVGVPVSLGFLLGGGGPSRTLAQRLIAGALAGRGTGDCLALPELAADPVALPPNWAPVAIMEVFSPEPSGSGYPHWYPGVQSFDSLIQPVYNQLGGDSPPPGTASTSYGTYVGKPATSGYQALDIWTLANPTDAARFATAYVAGECYRFSRDTTVPAGLVASGSIARYAIFSVVYGGGPGLVEVIGVVPFGRFVIRAEAVGPASEITKLRNLAATSLIRVIRIVPRA
ncbi:MAG: hypothetical protein ACYCTI_13180 [Acidimicrobiales bacterium]